MLCIKLALAYFRRRKLRAILTTLSVMAAIASLVAWQGLNGSIDYASGELVSLLGGKAQLEVKAPQGGMSDSVLAVVQKTVGVQAAVPFVQYAAQVHELPGFTTIMGIVPGEDEIIRNYQVIQGRMPAEDRREIAVPQELLQGLHSQLGDVWHIPTIEGMQDFRLVGVLDDGGVVKTNNGAVVFMTMATAQKAFGLEGKLSYISVVLQNPGNVISMQKALQTSLGNSAEVFDPARQSDRMDTILLHIKSMDNVYGFMGLFLALYVMYNSMRVAVTEQQSEIGILRALGWRQWEIHKLVFTQALTIGVIGSSLGLFLGTFLAQGLLSTASDYLNEMFKIDITRTHFTALNYTVIWLTGVMSCLISAGLPAWKAAAIAPIQAMNCKYSKIEQGYARWRAVVGAILIIISSWIMMIYGGNKPLLFQVALTGNVIGAAGLMPPVLIFFLQGLEPLAEKIFGLPGRLGVSSFRRNTKRIVSTGMPILLGLGIAFGCLGVYAGFYRTVDNYIKTLISPDIIINQGVKAASVDQVGLPDNILARVRQEDGVRAVAGLRTTGIQWHGSPVDIQAIDVAEWRQFTQPPLVQPGLDQALDDLQKGGEIWISQAMALKYGLTTGLKLSIPTPAGLMEFPVGGIVKDFSSLNGVLYMNRQDYIRYWGDQSIDYVLLSLNKGVSPNLLRDRLDADLKSDFRVQVMLSSDYRNSISKMLSSLIGIFNLVILVVLLVAAVGTANSMLISVLERVREVGTLRSVGFTRGQIAGMFMIEVGCLFIAGILLSIPVAVSIQIFGYILFKNVYGWVLVASIPWANNICMALAMALVVGLSAVYPAWLASKVEQVKVLRAE